MADLFLMLIYKEKFKVSFEKIPEVAETLNNSYSQGAYSLYFMI